MSEHAMPHPMPFRVVKCAENGVQDALLRANAARALAGTVGAGLGAGVGGLVGGLYGDDLTWQKRLRRAALGALLGGGAGFGGGVAYFNSANREMLALLESARQQEMQAALNAKAAIDLANSIQGGARSVANWLGRLVSPDPAAK